MGKKLAMSYHCCISPLDWLTPKRDQRRGSFTQGKGGAWGRIRTTDTRIFNPLLYQLSYPGARIEMRERGL